MPEPTTPDSTKIRKLAQLRDRLRGRSAEVALGVADVHPNLTTAVEREARGDLAGAVESLTAALAVNPTHLQVNRLLASLLERMGDSAGAALCWRRAVANAGGDDLEDLTRFGIALSDNAQHEEAVGVLANVAQRTPSVGAAHANLGMALLAAGRVRECESAFSRALTLDPRSAQAHCGLGLAYQKQRRWQEAARAFETTEALAPDNAVGPLNLGLALDALGDREGARRALLRAAALAPEDQEIRAAIDDLRAAVVALADEREPDSSSISGDLRSFPLPEILEFLRVQAKSGTLLLRSGRQQGVVHLARGAVTDASVSTSSGPRPGVAVVPPPTREVALAGVMAGLGQMLSWPDGTFAFHRQEHPAVHPHIAFDSQHLLLELFKVSDERKRPLPRR